MSRIDAHYREKGKPEAGSEETPVGDPELGTAQEAGGHPSAAVEGAVVGVAKNALGAAEGKGKSSGDGDREIVASGNAGAPLPVMVHWLLASDAALPRVMGPNQPLPASFCSRKVLGTWLNSTKQPPAADTVLSFGGFLGMGDKLFAIPWSALALDTVEKRFILNVDKELLKRAPGFDKDHWPNMADHAWGSKAFTYYGAKPYWD